MQAWNHQWTSRYGSRDFKVSDDQVGRDDWTITSATLPPDGKTVILTVPGIRPCMQYLIKAKLDFAGTASLKQEIAGTIHALGRPPP